MSNASVKKELSKNFLKVPMALFAFIELGAINNTDILVYSTLLNALRDEWEELFPSQSTIAKKLKMHRTTVNGSLKRMAKVGLLSMEGEFGYSCNYQFHDVENALSQLKNPQKHSLELQHIPVEDSTWGDASTSLSRSYVFRSNINNNNKTPTGYSGDFGLGIRQKENYIGEGSVQGTEFSTELVSSVGESPLPPLVYNNETCQFNASSLEVWEIEVRGDQRFLRARHVQLAVPAKDVVLDAVAFSPGLAGLNQNTILDDKGASEPLHGAHEALGGDVGLPFSKKKQLRGKEPKEPKTKWSKEPKEKKSRNTPQFEELYKAYYHACHAYGFVAPTTGRTNSTIDDMIAQYGVEDSIKIVQHACKNWHRITKIVTKFDPRPIPALSQIALGFVCEHLFADVMAEEKGLKVEKKKKKLTPVQEQARLMKRRKERNKIRLQEELERMRAEGKADAEQGDAEKASEFDDNAV